MNVERSAMICTSLGRNTPVLPVVLLQVAAPRVQKCAAQWSPARSVRGHWTNDHAYRASLQSGVDLRYHSHSPTNLVLVCSSMGTACKYETSRRQSVGGRTSLSPLKQGTEAMCARDETVTCQAIIRHIYMSLLIKRPACRMQAT
jgi:hypothetical protein